MTTGLYTTKWFLQCFIDRVSLPLVSHITISLYLVSKNLLLAPPTEPVHAHAAFMGHLHVRGREDADRHGVHHPEAAQK